MDWNQLDLSIKGNKMIEIIARFNDTGIFLGGHTRDAAGMPTSVSVAQLPGVINTANVAAMARVAVLEAELSASNALLAALKTTAAAAAQAVVTVVNDESMSDAEKAAACKRIAVQVRQPVYERELDAADKVIADAIAAREKLVRAV